MERNAKMIYMQKHSGCAKYIVNLLHVVGKNQKTETKVPDRTKGGREGKTLL